MNEPDALRLAWYGDDFTGAADTLATLAEAGWRAALFLAAPTDAQRERCGTLDALGVAGTARALAPPAMREQIAPVAAAFARLRPRLTQYKCCSTFDSAAQVGNLAAGLQALRQPEHDPTAIVLGGQPSLGRLCLGGTLFASAGAGGELHRLDRHPTMSRHPVTPMAEADLRRHLGALGLPRVALVDARALDAPDEAALRVACERALADAPPALLFDLTREAQLERIGRWLDARARQRPQLLLGASSVAQALTRVHPTRAQAAAVAPADGPVFLLVGSLSPVTAAQCAAAQAAYARVDLGVAEGGTGADWLARRAEQCAALLRGGRSVLAVTGAPRADGPSPLVVARRSGQLLAEVLRRVPALRRAGVAGGDSSGFAVQALAPWALRWQGTLAPGVPLLRLQADTPALDGLELMLKGGQMGPPEVFLRLLHGT